MIDPYEPPKADAGETEPIYKEHVLTGPPCPECGSANTSIDSVLRARPNIIAVILFDWVFLLIRGALATRKSICLDCGGVHPYKSTGSWIALGIVILFALIIVMAMIEG